MTCAIDGGQEHRLSKRKIVAEKRALSHQMSLELDGDKSSMI